MELLQLTLEGSERSSLVGRDIRVEVEAYKKGGFKVMKVIHGYGSHGVGGAIKNAFLKKCQDLFDKNRFFKKDC